MHLIKIKKLPAFTTKQLTGLLILFLMASASSCTNIKPSKTKPAAANGIIDLREWDFQADGRTHLIGDWKFKWLEDNPSFADPKFDDSSWVNLSERGFWNKVSNSGTGYGWYRLHIKLDKEKLNKNKSRLGLYVYFFISSYELYVNGTLLTSAGKFGKTKAEAEPRQIPRFVMIDIPSGSEDVVIAMRCSNFYHRAGGGALDAPEIGLYDDLKQQLWVKDFIDILLLGIILMMGVYHLFLWIGRREDKASLYFTIGCFIVFLRLMATGLYFQILFPMTDLYEFNFKIIYLSMPIGSMSFILFFHELFPEDSNRKLVSIFKIINAALIIATIFTTCSFYSRFSIIYEGMMFFTGISMFIIIIIAYIRKRQWAAFMLPGSFLILASSINDILVIKLIVDLPLIASFGLAALIFSQAAVLSNRFAAAYKTAEHLTSFLKEEVDNKTRDLTERTREAEDAKKEIEKANASLVEKDSYKSLFFQNITHEFRTPLTLIIGYIEKAINSTQKDNPEILKSQYQIILLNARRLLRLINQLLDISKIDAHKMQLEEEALDIVNFTKNIAAYFNSPAIEKKIDFSLQCEEEKIIGLFDRSKIEKILYNILSNALKFTGKNGKISISIKRNNSQVIISISDTGIGIEESKLPRIFERFYQADNSSMRDHEGTGIGLSLVKEYVIMHNGSIDVQSIHGKGSIFTVTLPLKKSSLTVDEEKNLKSHDISESALIYTSDIVTLNKIEIKNDIKKDEPEIFTKDRPQVLLVEDNSDMRLFMNEILSTRYLVTEAENGIDALLKLSEKTPELIISDIMMPEMDGYQLLYELKKNPATVHIPVILLTAKVGEDDKIMGIEYGADDYIHKPFSSRELITRANSLIKLYRYHRLLAERNKEIEKGLEIARAIQSKLIMIDPADHNDNFFAYYLPLDKVAGDFYFYSENEETADIFIADVSGHGVASAFLSLVARNELESLINNKTGILSVMKQLNNVILRYTVNEIFITAFYCIYNKNTKKLTYCGAGHNYPLQINHQNGAVTELKTKGTLLGLFSEIKFEEKEVLLQKDDRIIFYTDGLIEIFNESRDMYGENRLRKFAEINYKMKPDEFSKRLIKETTEFAGTDEFKDDVTLLIFDVP